MEVLFSSFSVSSFILGFCCVLLFVLPGFYFFLKARFTSEVSKLSAERSVLEERFRSVQDELAERGELQEAAIHREKRISELETLLEEERRLGREKKEEVDRTIQGMQRAFEGLSAEALRNNNKAFMELAQNAFGKLQESAKQDLSNRQSAIGEVLQPLKESLEKMRVQVEKVEKERVGAYSSLVEQVRSLSETQQMLQHETGNLARSLRQPAARGRWGEVQLRRVVEIAGMSAHCDFTEQTSVTSEDGARLRPDMVVRLPGKKTVVVDSKASLIGYIEAIEAQSEDEKKVQLLRHARLVRAHIKKLSEKSYWQQFENAPEFVVLFLPGECFFSAALEQDSELIEYGMRNQVVIATPTTLIALLRAVAYGWDQERVAESALLIKQLGKELYERLGTMTSHLEDVRKGLMRAVDSYNKAIGSYESRVLVSARKLGEYVSSSTEETRVQVERIEHQPRTITSSLGESSNGESESRTSDSLSNEPN
ncbi:MAG: DNA recombination protein RmuC [Bdellovibrionales bacterium]|nr:DNA recombination protein RmuC [Bdellovibrionales bacterium]